ncbi:MAG: ABC transporter permease [Oscillospiraceae bacterium]|nr:ABC transporter permease [Oscillospiraceae bacterium]
MSKLLRANLTRLFKNKLFRGEIIFMIFSGIIAALGVFAQHKIHLNYGQIITLDKVFYGYSLLIGILTAILSSLFLGTEYSDGTMRNKVICGHRKINIYFSNLITIIIAALLLCAVYLVTVTVVGTPLVGFVTQSCGDILLKLLGSIALVIAFSSVFTLISMVCVNKTVSAIISVLSVAIFSVIAWQLNEYTNWLDSPGTPVYLCLTFFYSFLPTGQAIQYGDIDNFALPIIYIWKMLLSSLFVAAVTTVIGSRIFRKKDLK